MISLLSLMVGSAILRMMNHKSKAVTIDEKTPGAQVPIEATKNPPTMGVTIDVMLSNEALSPKMPPISSLETA